MNASKTIDTIYAYALASLEVMIYGAARTEVVGHHELIRQRLFSSDSYDRLALAQGFEADFFAIFASPSDLFLNCMEQGNRIAKTIWNINISKGERNQDNFKLFRRCRKGKQHSKNVINSLMFKQLASVV